MPPPTKISRLPQAVRQELACRLRDNGFGALAAASDWLRAQGHEIGKSSVGVFARQLRHLAGRGLPPQEAAERVPGLHVAQAPKRRRRNQPRSDVAHLGPRTVASDSSEEHLRSLIALVAAWSKRTDSPTQVLLRGCVLVELRQSLPRGSFVATLRSLNVSPVSAHRWVVRAVELAHARCSVQPMKKAQGKPRSKRGGA